MHSACKDLYRGDVAAVGSDTRPSPRDREASGGTQVDGRSARAARTRDAVVDAVLALCDEGQIRPTAGEIAERAGVSVRSVYVHFDDLDDLFTAAAARHYQRTAALLHPVDATLPLAERIAAVVEQRSAVYEATAAVRRGALAWAHESPALTAILDRAHGVARRDVARVFAAELDTHGSPGDPDRETLLESLHVVTSSSAWDVLRIQRGLSSARAEAVVGRALAALLSPRRADR